MPEVLSQSQIDELLNSMVTGSTSEEEEKAVKDEGKKVKEYNFKTPKKLAKEHIKTLQGINEKFGRYLASYFSGILRTYSEITVNSIEELPYYEYNNALPDIEMMGIYDQSPIEGSVLVDISNSITFSLIDRLLGGSGIDSALDREFTEIEVSLMRRIFNQIGVCIRESWSGFLSLKAELQQIETNARLIQTLPMDEVVVIVTMDVAISETKGTMSFCIPCINLESTITQIEQEQNEQLRQNRQTYTRIKSRKPCATNMKISMLELRAAFWEKQSFRFQMCAAFRWGRHTA
jgi:flagellar motor switch protein FliM